MATPIFKTEQEFHEWIEGQKKIAIAKVGDVAIGIYGSKISEFRGDTRYSYAWVDGVKYFQPRPGETSESMIAAAKAKGRVLDGQWEDDDD